MNVVWTSLCIQYFYLFQIAQLTQDFSYVFFDLLTDYLLKLFGYIPAQLVVFLHLSNIKKTALIFRSVPFWLMQAL